MRSWWIFLNPFAKYLRWESCHFFILSGHIFFVRNIQDDKINRDIRLSLRMLIPLGKPIVENILIIILVLNFISPKLTFESSRPSVYHFSLQIHAPLDPATKQQKGLAYVTFTRSTHALAAYEALDKKLFQGRLLHTILAAVDRKAKFEVLEGDGKKSVKDKKNAKRKAMSGKEFNWSMLYMNVGTLYFKDNFLVVSDPLLCRATL